MRSYGMLTRFVLLSLVAAGCLGAQPAPVLFHNVRLFDGTAVVPNADVDNPGRQDPGGGHGPRRARCTRRGRRRQTLLPGRIDAHAHVHSRESLEQALAFGVTTELDLMMPPGSSGRSRRSRATTLHRSSRPAGPQRCRAVTADLEWPFPRSPSRAKRRPSSTPGRRGIGLHQGDVHRGHRPWTSLSAAAFIGQGNSGGGGRRGARAQAARRRAHRLSPGCARRYRRRRRRIGPPLPWPVVAGRFWTVRCAAQRIRHPHAQRVAKLLRPGSRRRAADIRSRPVGLPRRRHSRGA